MDINHLFKTFVLNTGFKILDNTEERILNAATEVFRRRGFAGAKTEELAREAGVNKALLNYYFRSKEKLFQRVFELSMGDFISRVQHLLKGDLPLDMKVYKVVDLYTRMLLDQPDLPIFIISEIRAFPSHFSGMMKESLGESMEVLQRQLDDAFEQGHIRQTSAFTFLMNTLGMTVFPFIAAPLVQHVFGMDKDKFKAQILKRKQELPEMIISTLRP